MYACVNGGEEKGCGQKRGEKNKFIARCNRNKTFVLKVSLLNPGIVISQEEFQNKVM